MADPFSTLTVLASLDAASYQLLRRVRTFLAKEKGGLGDELDRLVLNISIIGEHLGLLLLLQSERDLNRRQEWLVVQRLLQDEDNVLREIDSHMREASDLFQKITKRSQSRFSVFSRAFGQGERKRLNAVISHLERDADQLQRYLRVAETTHEVRTLQPRHGAEAGYHDNDILEWISPSDPAATQSDLRDRRLRSAAAWLSEDKQYERWALASSRNDHINKILWLPGDPGIGKTFLATRRHGSTVVTYFYCDYRLRDSLSAVYILASLLKQLASRMNRLPQSLLDLYKSHHQGIDTSASFLDLRLDDVRAEFLTVAKSFDQVFIIIDALDESSPTERSSLLRILIDIPDSIQVLVTSRPETDIKKHLEGYPKIVPSPRDLGTDIESYIDTLVQRLNISAVLDKDIKHREAREETKKDIVKGIYRKSGDVFLLANLHTQRIAKCNTVAEIKKKLAEFPATLEEVYTDYLQAIRDQSSSYQMQGAKRILSWIFKAKRPLRIRELQQAIATSPGDTSSTRLSYHDVQTIVDWCLGLVTVNAEQSSIRFVHFSVQEFLEKQPSFLENDCTIAKTCLTFLRFEDFAKGKSDNVEALEKLSRDFPFLEYAARYWAIHGKTCEEQGFRELALEFVSSESHLACAAQLAHYGGPSPDGSDRTLSHNVSGLHVVASFGLQWLASALLTTGADVNVMDDQGQTPLLYAARQGHTPLLELFAKQGAEIDKRDNSYHRSPLSWATLNGHAGVVKWLLSHKSQININSFDYQHSTPLHIAFERHHYDIVDLLIGQGASLNLVDQWQRTQAELAFSGSLSVDLNLYVKEKQRTKQIAQGGQAKVTVFQQVGHDHKSLDPFPFLFRKAFITTGVEGAETLRLLVQERDYLRNLHHPNIVKFIAYKENDDHSKAFLWTEYCNGGDLSKFIRKDFGNDRIIEPQWKLSRREVWHIFADLAAAVSYLHVGLIKESNSFSLKTHWDSVIHRDIKPANVVISSQKDVQTYKLCDLGIAKIWDPAASQTRKGRGTSSWMPKEVKEQLKPWTVKGDIFSLGATMKDLAKDFSDETLTSLVDQCTDDIPSKRPNCLTVLQIAREQLALVEQADLPPFLPERPNDMDYVQQAIFELLERMFHSFHIIETSLRRHLTEKLKTLIQDGELRNPECWQLKKSIVLMLVLAREKEAESLISSGLGSWDCPWKTYGLTPKDIAEHDGLAIANLVARKQPKTRTAD